MKRMKKLEIMIEIKKHDRIKKKQRIKKQEREEEEEEEKQWIKFWRNLKNPDL